MYLITFSKQASKDKQLLKSVGLDKKARELLNIMLVNPFQNPPPYEKLTGNLSGYFSRRINLLHRLVYCTENNIDQIKDANGNVYEGIVYVKRMWTRYE